MSKKSKKKQFNKVEVQWKDDDSMLPTVASAIQDRRDRRPYGGGGGGWGNKPEFDDTERGPWRRGPSGGGGGGGGGSNAFGSNRGSRGPSSFNSFNSFRSSRSPPNETDSKPSGSMDINASDNDTNWRGGKKKEQPKISLNSRASSTNNINPWRNNNNNNNNNNNMNNNNMNNNNNNINNNNDMQRNAFGSKSVPQPPSTSSFSRNNRYGDNNRYGSSKFGGSSFGGGSSKFGSSASTSKFNTGGGFGAAALKKMDNGTTRMTYSRNNRFGGIMDDNKREDKSVALEAPSKVQSSRFGGLSDNVTPRSKPSSQPSQQTAFPDLSNGKGPSQRREKTVEELKKEIRKENERNNEKNKIMKSTKNDKKQQQQQQQQQKGKIDKSDSKKSMEDKPVTNKKQQQQQIYNKQQQTQKVDKKLVRKFNKDCLGNNKSMEINADTERLILFGLSQKENILKREEDNYEKIANLLCGVMFDDQNLRNKNKKNVIDLDKIYNIIYNKTKLAESNKEFLALVLEILSVIEMKKTCLSVVDMINSKDMLNKYLCKTPNIETKKTMKEFDEYGLQYIYPLNIDIIKEMEDKIKNNISMEEIIDFLNNIKSKQIIYSNYKLLNIILSYIVKTFYFDKCVENDDEKNDEIAKKLIISDSIKQKTPFAQIISLLHCKDDDTKNNDDDDEDDEDEEDEDEDEEEDEDNDVDSHSLLILSSIITISGSLNNNNNGLVSILKTIELSRLISYKAIQRFVQCDDDKYTLYRLTALSKLTDWIADLDARQARLEMEKDNDYDDDDGVDNAYAGNLLAQRKHKTAADYEQISYIDVE